MSTPWRSEVRKTGMLKVHNLALGWSADVEKAITKFKALGFPVELRSEKEESEADVVVKLSTGADSHPVKMKGYEDITVKTAAGFRADAPHGSTVAVFAELTEEVLRAVIFLPGLLKNASAQLKEAIITHELIHACGMVSKEKDGAKNKLLTHDTEGIMYDIMVTSARGVVEGNAPKRKTMPPIRLGAKTKKEIDSAWKNE